jgi:hypothetical protein
MTNIEVEKPKPNVGESLYILMKSLPIFLFALGVVATFWDWSKGLAGGLMAAAIVLWVVRFVVITPLLKIIYGKRRLKAALAEHKDRF